MQIDLSGRQGDSYSVEYFLKRVSRGLGVKSEKKGSFLESLYTMKQSLEGEGGYILL